MNFHNFREKGQQQVDFIKNADLNKIFFMKNVYSTLQNLYSKFE